MKIVFFIMLVVIALFSAGCNSSIKMANGYGFAAPGLVFSYGIQGGASELNIDALKRPYKKLGRVSGTSTQVNTLLALTLGDISIEKAQNNALSKIKGADALINRNFDVEHLSVLGVLTNVTLRVTGDAIKYTDK